MKSLLVVDDDLLLIDLLSEAMWRLDVFVVSSPTMADASHTLSMFTPDYIIVNTVLDDSSRFISDPRVQAVDRLILLSDDGVHNSMTNGIVLDRRRTRLDDLLDAVTDVGSPFNQDVATELVRSVAKTA